MQIFKATSLEKLCGLSHDMYNDLLGKEKLVRKKGSQSVIIEDNCKVWVSALQIGAEFIAANPCRKIVGRQK